MEKVRHKLQASIGGNIGRNAIFREYIENEQMWWCHGQGSRSSTW